MENVLTEKERLDKEKADKLKADKDKLALKQKADHAQTEKDKADHLTGNKLAKKEEKDYGTATEGAHVRQLANDQGLDDPTTILPAEMPVDVENRPSTDVAPHTADGKIIDPFKPDPVRNPDPESIRNPSVISSDVVKPDAEMAKPKSTTPLPPLPVAEKK